jgi:hypothetical protein
MQKGQLTEYTTAAHSRSTKERQQQQKHGRTSSPKHEYKSFLLILSYYMKKGK